MAFFFFFFFFSNPFGDMTEKHIWETAQAATGAVLGAETPHRNS